MLHGTLFAFAVSITSALGALYQGPTQEILDKTYDFVIVGGALNSLKILHHS